MTATTKPPLPPVITLRDYFAAKAMQAILTADRTRGATSGDGYSFHCALDAYKMADAMLKVRG